MEPLVQVVLENVGRYYQVSAHALLSRKKTKSLVVARQTAMYVARMVGDFSFPELGKAFGGRSHQVIMKACRKVALRRIEEPLFREVCDRLVFESLRREA